MIDDKLSTKIIASLNCNRKLWTLTASINKITSKIPKRPMQMRRPRKMHVNLRERQGKRKFMQFSLSARFTRYMYSNKKRSPLRENANEVEELK